MDRGDPFLSSLRSHDGELAHLQKPDERLTDRGIVLDHEHDPGVTGHGLIIVHCRRKQHREGQKSQMPSRWLQVGPKRSGTSSPL